jgi:hypothetical protein
VVPDAVDERTGGHRPPGLDEQYRQHRALLGVPDVDRPAAVPQLDRAQ